MKTKKILSLLILLFILVLTGCQTKIPFEINPESTITIEHIEKEIKNAEKNKEFYEKYFQYRLLGVMPNGLEDMIEEIPDGELPIKIDNAEKLFLINLLNKGKPEEVDKIVKEEIQNYIKASKMKEKVDFTLSEELKKHDPIKKVQDYMAKNDIKVTEIIFPDVFEEKNTWNYPMKFRYRYVIKGTIKGNPFEKEIVQDFYIGTDSNLHQTIEYIK